MGTAATLPRQVYILRRPEKEIVQSQLMRLDDFVHDGELRRIDLIKMDVEGAEYAVCRGGENVLRKFQPTLLLELSDAALRWQNSSTQQLIDFLKDIGYSCHVLNGATGMIKLAANDDHFSDNIVAALPERISELYEPG
jgi:hypothetical protein